MKAKRRIHQFDFISENMPSGSKTHVALVDKAANMTEALVLKSKFTTQTSTVSEYDEESGKSSYNKKEVTISDYGDNLVFIEEETVSVVRSTADKINVIT